MTSPLESRVLVEIAVPAEDYAVPLVRHAFLDAVRGSNLMQDADPMDDVMTVATELTSNAVLHAGHFPGSIRARCVMRAGSVRVEVHDRSRQEPTPCGRVGSESTHGRGLGMVAGLSTDWGSFLTPDGKAVWAVIAFEPQDDGTGGPAC